MPFLHRVQSWLWMPARGLLAVRRSITAASASLLLIAIISLNIVWGYPWLGTFAATTAMMIVGFTANRLFGPRLQLQISPPNYAVVGEAFPVTMHLHHRGFLPTFDNKLAFHQRKKSWFGNEEWVVKPSDRNGSRWLPCIQAGQRMQTEISLVGSRRGIHPLPKVESKTCFPFHLFECQRIYSSGSNIAIAPAPLDRDTDPRCGQLIDQIKDQSQAWLAGDSYDYAGNREYQVGMPVRRWDFRSWARLGRPIVQEFQSPSNQTVTLILDASIEHGNLFFSTPLTRAVTGKQDKLSTTNHDFEELLRWVATAIDHFSRTNIAMQVYLSCNSAESFLQADHQGVIDLPSMLVQLACVEVIDHQQSQKRIEQVLVDLDPKTVFLFTLRSDWQGSQWRHDDDPIQQRTSSFSEDRIEWVNVIQFRPESSSSTEPKVAS